VEKYKVTLTVDERHALDRMVASGKAAARKLIHARILLLGDEGPCGPCCSDEEIAPALNVGLSTIGRVRRRFVTESLESAIHPRPRPPRPEKVIWFDWPVVTLPWGVVAGLWSCSPMN
jgi:hypothetical protein